jgi:hypothetical protein
MDGQSERDTDRRADEKTGWRTERKTVKKTADGFLKRIEHMA